MNLTADGEREKIMPSKHYLMDISVNMDATFYLICFYMFQKCAFWTDKFVFYNLLHRGCKLYLLLGRKDYKRTLNVIKI